MSTGYPSIQQTARNRSSNRPLAGSRSTRRSGSGVDPARPPAHAEPFRSVLWLRDTDEPGARPGAAPGHFRDLNLDQVVAAATRGRDDYELAPFFSAPLRDLDAIAYRHEVFRDLERDAVGASVRRFAAAMRLSREHLGVARKLYVPQQKWLWHLDAIETYCGAVQSLRHDIPDLDLQSRGLAGLGRTSTTMRAPTGSAG